MCVTFIISLLVSTTLYKYSSPQLVAFTGSSKEHGLSGTPFESIYCAPGEDVFVSGLFWA